MKLYNYGQKVVTNRMYGYLRMRIAQFLTTVHTTPHTIWLSRHGQSEYNVLGKIGGNPPLSRAGEEYARRLGPWVPHHVCVDAEGKTVKARLWTSSLQLCAFSIPLALAALVTHEAKALRDGGPLQGFDRITLLVLLLHVAGGVPSVASSRPTRWGPKTLRHRGAAAKRFRD